MEKTFTVADVSALPALVEAVRHEAAALPAVAATVLLLSGPLGAGKTAFTKVLAQSLGVTETVTSPTFVVMKSYETTDERFPLLTHIDAYRIDDEAEAIPLHLTAVLGDPTRLVVVEWPERLPQLAALPHIELTFAPTGRDEERIVTLINHGA